MLEGVLFPVTPFDAEGNVDVVAQLPKVIGFKDGVGNLARRQRVPVLQFVLLLM